MKKLLANSSGLHYHIHCLGHVVAHTLDVPLGSHRLAVAVGVSGPDHQGVPTGCGIPISGPAVPGELRRLRAELGVEPARAAVGADLHP